MEQSHGRENVSKAHLEKKKVLLIAGSLHLPDPAESLKEAYLIGSKCRKCGYICFPKRYVCPVCIQEGTMDETPLSRRGRVFSYTTAWVAPPGYKIPYTQAWVDLPEGVRVFTVISGRETSKTEVEVGTEVELVVEQAGEDKEGNAIMVHKFRPVA